MGTHLPREQECYVQTIVVDAETHLTTEATGENEAKRDEQVRVLLRLSGFPFHLSCAAGKRGQSVVGSRGKLNRAPWSFESLIQWC
jgi:hypothetical protein